MNTALAILYNGRMPSHPGDVKCFLVIPSGEKYDIKYDPPLGSLVRERGEFWVRADGQEGKFKNPHEFGVGAMWHCDWYKDSKRYFPGEDGLILCVVCPDGRPWVIDSPAANGAPNARGWSRSGVAPEITAHPSIDTGTWHGWLRKGTLTLNP